MVDYADIVVTYTISTSMQLTVVGVDKTKSLPPLEDMVTVLQLTLLNYIPFILDFEHCHLADGRGWYQTIAEMSCAC